MSCGCPFEGYELVESQSEPDATAKIERCSTTVGYHRVPWTDASAYYEALGWKYRHMAVLALDAAGLLEKYDGGMIDEIIADLEKEHELLRA